MKTSQNEVRKDLLVTYKRVCVYLHLRLDREVQSKFGPSNISEERLNKLVREKGIGQATVPEIAEACSRSKRRIQSAVNDLMNMKILLPIDRQVSHKKGRPGITFSLNLDNPYPKALPVTLEEKKQPFEKLLKLSQSYFKQLERLRGEDAEQQLINSFEFIISGILRKPLSIVPRKSEEPQVPKNKSTKRILAEEVTQGFLPEEELNKIKQSLGLQDKKRK